jgi:hypothetical protein
MAMEKEVAVIHREGEQELVVGGGPNQGSMVDTYGGSIHVKWDETAAVTPFGQLAFFIEFLKTAGLWDGWVKECPVIYESPNAPAKADVLGTILLSVLAGHRRYAHITALRFDGVNPQLLGMTKVCSEDSVRRAFSDVEAPECTTWLTRHLRISYEPLLKEPWILDIDSTVKPLYGHQEGAVKGYNPGKPGRPSHVYHTYFAANSRLLRPTVDSCWMWKCRPAIRRRRLTRNRSEALPNHGAHHRLGLQLVVPVYALGDSGKARRGHHQPPALVTRRRQANHSQRANHRHGHQHARQGAPDALGSASD